MVGALNFDLEHERFVHALGRQGGGVFLTVST